MSLIRMTNGFDREADAKLLERASFIHRQITGNNNFPSPLSTMPELLQVIDTLRIAIVAAGNGDRLMIAQKNVAYGSGKCTAPAWVLCAFCIGRRCCKSAKLRLYNG